MHRILTIAALAGMAAGVFLLAAGTAQAQSGRACFRQAEAFGQAVTAMGNLSQDITNPSSKLKEATDLRNKGMEACLAGKTKEGRAMIEQATAMLKG